MMNDNNTGPGIAGEPEPAVPPEAEQTSVSLPSFIAPFPPVRPPAAFAHYRLPGGKDSGASFGKIRKLLPSGNPFLLFLAWRRDLPRRGAAVRDSGAHGGDLQHGAFRAGEQSPQSA